MLIELPFTIKLGNLSQELTTSWHMMFNSLFPYYSCFVNSNALLIITVPIRTFRKNSTYSRLDKFKVDLYQSIDVG